MKSIPLRFFCSILVAGCLFLPAQAEFPATLLKEEPEPYSLASAQRFAEAQREPTVRYYARMAALRRELAPGGSRLPQPGAWPESFWADDQPELRQALLKSGWMWRSEMDGEGVNVTFSGDGAVRHAGLRGTWKITGPSEVTIQSDDDGTFVLRFNASLTLFLGDRRAVTGARAEK